MSDERGGLDDRRVSALSTSKQELLRRRLAGRRTSSHVEHRLEVNPAPASWPQRGVWVAHARDETRTVYNLAFAYDSAVRLSPSAIERAILEIASVQESLRTHFSVADGELVQVIGEPTIVLERGQVETQDLETRLLQFAQAPFRLDEGPLFRAALLSLDERDVLALCFHHTVCDAPSVQLFIESLAQLYGDNYSVARKPPFQYRDFTRWLGERVRERSVREAMAAIADMPPLLFDPRTIGTRGSPSTRSLEVTVLEKHLAPGVSELCVGLAAVVAALYQHTGRDDIVVGVPISLRDPPGSEALIGLFLSTLPVRIRLTPQQPFSDLVEETRQALAKAVDARHVPLDEVDQSAGQGLFDVFVTREAAPTEGIVFGASRLSPITVFPDRTAQQFPISVYFGTSGDRCHMTADVADGLGISSSALLSLIERVLRSGAVERRRSAPHSARKPGAYIGAAPADHGEFAHTSEVQNLFAEILKVERFSATASLFELGYTSLSAIRIVAAIEDRFGVALSVRTFFERPTPVAVAEELVRANRTFRRIEKRARSDREPASAAQRRLWMAEQVTDGPQLTVAFAFEIEGPLDGQRLQLSLNEMVARHEALRTRFSWDGHRLWQHIEPPFDFPLEVVDDGSVEHRLEASAEQHFDLGQLPLAVGALVRTGRDRHVFTLHVHHIIADRGSVELLMQELADAYRGVVLPEVVLQYADFSRWEAEQPTEVSDALRVELEGVRAFGRPLSDQPPARKRTSTARSGSATLSRDLVEQIRTMGRTRGVTPLTVFLTAYAIVLSRFSGAKDFVIGIPGSMRTQAALERTVGFFVNLLPIRFELGDTTTFAELVDVTGRRMATAIEHRAVSFDRLVQWLGSAGRNTDTPLLASFVIEQDSLRLGDFGEGLTLRSIQPPSLGGGFDLLLAADFTAGRIHLEVEADRYSDSMIEALMYSTLAVVDAGTNEPDRSVWTLPLAEAPSNELADARDPAPELIVDRILKRAKTTPDMLAVRTETKQHSYAELLARATVIAAALQDLGAQPEDRVAIVMSRSFSAVAAQLGALLARTAFVPIDPSLPEAQIVERLKQCKPKAVLSCDDRAGAIDVRQLTPAADQTIGSRPQSDELAYLIFTSGSSGVPKPVMLTHRGLSCLVEGQIAAFSVRPGQSVLNFASPSFDAAVSEVFVTLAAGATLCIPSESDRQADRITETLCRFDIDLATLPPSVLSVCPPLEGRCRTIVSAGEKLPHSVAGRFAAHRLYNAYGPTEFTVCATIGAYDEALGSSASIGVPVPGARVYVLDEQLRPVPRGAIGQLYLAGPQLARGYFEQPELTEAVFLKNPFSPDPRERMYATGDRVRWLARGLEFVGRADRQVKIRSHRVELGEIESRLARFPGVREAVVVYSKTSGFEGRLDAFAEVESPDHFDIEAWMEASLASLPDPMHPAGFAVMAEIPRTPSGKPDHERLKRMRPDVRRRSQQKPRTPLERTLARGFEEILDLDRVSAHDDFFECGGSSLSAIQLFAYVEKRTGQRLPVSTLFKARTPAELAQCIDARKRATASCMLEIASGGDHPPLFVLPSLGGETLYWRHVVNHLADDQPVYGFQLPWEGTRMLSFDRVEDLAERYVDELCDFQPEGPIRLAGYCFAGMLAYEMAGQLERRGRSISLLAMIEPSPAPTARRGLGEWMRDLPAWAGNVPRWLRDDFLLNTPEQRRIRTRRALGMLFRRVKAAIVPRARPAIEADNWEDFLNLEGLSEDHRQAKERHYLAQLKYEPQPIEASVTIIRATAAPLFAMPSPALGWDTRGPVEILSARGGHLTLFLEPHAEGLAAVLRAVLERSWKPSQS